MQYKETHLIIRNFKANDFTMSHDIEMLNPEKPYLKIIKN